MTDTTRAFSSPFERDGFRWSCAALLAMWSLSCLLGCRTTRPYNRTPDWMSEVLPNTTGLATADINGDGALDLLSASGNDIAPGHLVVFFNDGRGGFPSKPHWVSSDTGYFTNIAVGDVNHDGWMDVAVSVGLGPQGQVDGGWVQLYMNQKGHLEPTPSFVTSDRFSSFACLLADIDGDADLDLLATAMDLTDDPPPVRVYRNEGGHLSKLPTWTPQDLGTAYGLDVADVDGNGLLDIITAGARGRIYAASLNSQGDIVLPSSATWTSENGSALATYVASGSFGPQTRVVLSYNDLCYVTHSPCGTSKPASYEPHLSPQSNWMSGNGGLGSGIALVPMRGQPTALVVGRWGLDSPTGAPLELYAGTGSIFEEKPVFSTKTLHITEAIAVADFRGTSLQRSTQSFSVSGSWAVLSLSHPAVANVVSVWKNDKPVPLSHIAHVPGESWVSFAERLQNGDRVRIEYVHPLAVDVALADLKQGTALYRYQP